MKLGLDSRNLEVGILLSSSSSSLLLLAKVSLLRWGSHLDELTPAVTWTECKAIQHIGVLEMRQCC